MDNVKDNATMMSAMKATAKELKAAYKELDIDGTVVSVCFLFSFAL
jgi:hypothetical protein